MIDESKLFWIGTLWIIYLICFMLAMARLIAWGDRLSFKENHKYDLPLAVFGFVIFVISFTVLFPGR